MRERVAPVSHANAEWNACDDVKHAAGVANEAPHTRHVGSRGSRTQQQALAAPLLVISVALLSHCNVYVPRCPELAVAQRSPVAGLHAHRHAQKR